MTCGGYWRAGRMDRLAVEAYEQCLKLAPNFATARSNMAIALTHLGAEEKSADNKDEAIRCEVDPLPSLCAIMSG